MHRSSSVPEECYDKYTIYKEVAVAVMRAHHEHERDILAFLPGQADIQRCEELLIATLASTQTQVYPLYGNLSPERQRKTIAPSLQGERKIVLATPIAETSLTIV